MVKANGQRGIALISVLLITSLATLIVSDILARQRHAMISASNQIVQQQLWQLALSGETWVRAQLQDDWRNELEPKRVHLGQSWARGTKTFEIGDGQISIRIDDLNSRFDLNSLLTSGDSISRERYQRLLQSLALPPHDPSHVPISFNYVGKPLGWNDSSELMRLNSIDAEVMKRLRQWVRTTPGALNVNTATAHQFASLGQIDLARASAMVNARPADGYKTILEFLESPPVKQSGITAHGLGVDSSHFQAEMDIELGDRRIRLTSQLRIEPDGQVTVLKRTVAGASRVPE